MARKVTEKQKKIAKLIVENEVLDKPLNGGEMLVKVGYSESMATAKVNDVLESEGVRQALSELGFSENGAKKVVEEIMYSKETDASARLKATDQVFKVQGSYAPEKSVNVNVELEASTEVKELTEKLNQLYGGSNSTS